MNGSWTDVDNLLDLLDHVWIGVVMVAVAGIPSYFAARNHKGIKDIKNQVQNGHTETNLRDDIDRALDAIASLVHDVRGIRADLMAEEDRRRRDVANLEDRIGRHRKQES